MLDGLWLEILWSDLEEPRTFDLQNCANVVLFSEHQLIVKHKFRLVREYRTGMHRHDLGLLDCEICIILLENSHLGKIACQNALFYVIIVR